MLTFVRRNYKYPTAVVTPEAVDQAHVLLPPCLLLRGFRLQKTIADPILDGLQSRAVRMTRKAGLDRRWFARKHRQTIAFQVLREIHEYIHAVSPDHFGESRIRHAYRAAPLLGMPAKFFRQLIRLHDPRITENLQVPPIVALEQGNQIPAHHVVPKVR